MIRKLFLRQNNYANHQTSRNTRQVRGLILALLLFSFVSLFILGFFNEDVCAYWSNETEQLSSVIKADISVGRWIEEGFIDEDSRIIEWDPDNPPKIIIRRGDIIVYPDDNGGHIFYVALKTVNPSDENYDPGKPNDRWIRRMSYSEDTREYRPFHRYERGDYAIENGTLYKWNFTASHKPNWFSEERPGTDSHGWIVAAPPPGGSNNDYWFRYKLYYKEDVVYWNGYWYKSLSSGTLDQEPVLFSAYWERLPEKPESLHSASSMHAFGMARELLSPEELQIEIESLQAELQDLAKRESAVFDLASEYMKASLNQALISELDKLNPEQLKMLMSEVGLSTIDETEFTALSAAEEFFASEPEAVVEEDFVFDETPTLSDGETKESTEALLTALREKSEVLKSEIVEAVLSETLLEQLLRERILLEVELAQAMEQKDLLVLSELSTEEALQDNFAYDNEQIEDEDNNSLIEYANTERQDSEDLDHLVEFSVQKIRESLAQIAEEQVKQTYLEYLRVFAEKQADVLAETAEIVNEENLPTELSLTEAEPSVEETIEIAVETEVLTEVLETSTEPSQSQEAPEEIPTELETEEATMVTPSVSEKVPEPVISETMEEPSELSEETEISHELEIPTEAEIVPTMSDFANGLSETLPEEELLNETTEPTFESETELRFTEVPSDNVEETDFQVG